MGRGREIQGDGRTDGGRTADRRTDGRTETWGRNEIEGGKQKNEREML